MAKKPVKKAPASVVTRAELTEQRIAECMEADQGSSFRHYLRYYIGLQEDAFRPDDGPRSHLGASQIGRACDRELWYGFRWATVKHHDARVLRLFNRGHLEEGRFLAILASIGCTLYQLDPQGRQFNVTGYGGHYGGSLDCVIEGCPDWPTAPILGEFKTASAKSFEKIVAEGIRVAKPEYYSQACQYMPAYNLPACLFMIVNKDNDDIYCELVVRDDEQAQADYSKAGDIIFAETPPPRINDSPGYFMCQFCDHAPICHSGEENAVAVSCRTCAHVTVCENGTFVCENIEHQTDLGVEQPIVLDRDSQLRACDRYEPFTDYLEE